MKTKMRRVDDARKKHEKYGRLNESKDCAPKKEEVQHSKIGINLALSLFRTFTLARRLDT